MADWPESVDKMATQTLKPRSARTILVSLLIMFEAGGALATAGDWSFDAVYGAATVSALPGGRAKLVRDGAGNQARRIDYAGSDGSALYIERFYGPLGRKAIENNNGAVLHHVYGTGELTPLMRIGSDGTVIYQVGSTALSMAVHGGTSTVAHRVVDFKGSTVAVRDSDARYGQRLSYSTTGDVRPEQASTSLYSAVAQLAGYEGLTLLSLNNDQLLDNRARLYEPASARYLGLDAARQAYAYAARANNPVTRADTDGNVNFDKLIAALKADPTIWVAFGEDHGDPGAQRSLMHLTNLLDENRMNYLIFYENGILSLDEVDEKESYYEKLAYLKKMEKVWSLDGDNGVKDFDAAEKEHFNSVYDTSAMKKDYRLVAPEFYKWKQSLADIRKSMDGQNTINLFIFGAAHLESPKDLIAKGKVKKVPGGEYFAVESHMRNSVVLFPSNSFDLATRYNMVQITPSSLNSPLSRGIRDVQEREPLYIKNAEGLSRINVDITMRANVYARHTALIKSFKSYGMMWADKDDEKNELSESSGVDKEKALPLVTPHQMKYGGEHDLKVEEIIKEFHGR